MLRKIWRAKQITINTKRRIFNSNVKAVLLYRSETWRSTQKTLKRIQTFINKCLIRTPAWHLVPLGWLPSHLSLYPSHRQTVLGTRAKGRSAPSRCGIYVLLSSPTEAFPSNLVPRDWLHLPALSTMEVSSLDHGDGQRPSLPPTCLHWFPSVRTQL